MPVLMTAERSPQSGLPVFVEGGEGQVRPDDEALNTLASDGFTDGFRDPFTACDREVTIGLAGVGEAQPRRVADDLAEGVTVCHLNRVLDVDGRNAPHPDHGSGLRRLGRDEGSWLSLCPVEPLSV